MKDFKKQIYILAGVACFGISGMASASPIIVSVANCGGGGVTVSASTITWTPPTLGGTAGCIQTGGTTSFNYTGGGGGTLGPNVTGNILNLTTGGGIVDGFMTFAVPTAYTIDFVLDGLGPGAASSDCNLNGTTKTTCSPGGGPFILTYIDATDTAIALRAFGTVTDGATTYAWSGSFTTQLSDSAIDIATIEGTGGSISSTHSATFTLAAVPEPGTISMFLLAGVGLIGIGRKRFAKR